MGQGRRWRGVFAACLVAVVAAGAQDWSQWRGPKGDGLVDGFAAPQVWPEALKKGWTATLGSGCATPALVGDRLYVFTRQGEQEVVRCLNAGDGSEIWKAEYPTAAVKGPASRFPGPRSSPAVAEGKVVTLGVAGVLSCFDAATGKQVWQKDPFSGAVPKFFTSSSPLIVDGMAVAHLGGQGKGAMIAYDLASGAEKWRWGGEGPAYASPTLMTVAGVKQVVTLAEKSVVGVGLADGKLLWQLPFSMARYNAATPVVDGQIVIYGGAGRNARSVKAAKIEKQGDGFAATALWENPEIAPMYNTPVLEGDLLYGLSDQGKLFCLNAKTGKTAWIDDTQRDRSGFGCIVGTGSCLLALCSNAELIAYQPSAEGYQQLAALKVSDSSTHAYPVVSGKRIFVKDQDSLSLWTLN